ncbi:hypothetical protein CJP74_05470 [Psittacicella melopsittaci]|uniref:Uncharacterized protein n=1 Tax=Psittacicella melopsittaci TaxID=2028576 RepID=A0A3A1Y7I6_9GAMM|nr:hypothetical protein [Psittacicella melopsittaci]RIY32097.1 hypothetical protein CJP74_05470 [Psittacicella melopsittaci]
MKIKQFALAALTAVASLGAFNAHASSSVQETTPSYLEQYPQASATTVNIAGRDYDAVVARNDLGEVFVQLGDTSQPTKIYRSDYLEIHTPFYMTMDQVNEALPALNIFVQLSGY